MERQFKVHYGDGENINVEADFVTLMFFETTMAAFNGQINNDSIPADYFQCNL